MAKGHGFTKDEYKHILGLLNKGTQETHSNITGMSTCIMSNLFSEEWILDSGATHHITSKTLLRRGYSNATKRDKVNLPTGDAVDISHIGNVPIFANEAVKSALFVLDFKFNLLSVSKITRELSCFVSFYPDFCVF